MVYYAFCYHATRCMLFAYYRRNRCRHGRRYHSLFIPLKSPATDIPQQQLSQREHASVSSRTFFFAIEINHRQRPLHLLFGFSFHCIAVVAAFISRSRLLLLFVCVLFITKIMQLHCAEVF